MNDIQNYVSLIVFAVVLGAAIISNLIVKKKLKDIDGFVGITSRDQRRKEDD